MTSVSPGVQPPHFKVGWICAVEVEYVIACELLDEEYPDLPPVSANDDNVYTCGRMAQHDIVLACLPKGKYGITSAATVAKDMLRSFPAIRFGMMVGIGGGAPSPQHDIRLGDVVVSTPTLRTGGVIHYEMGKTIQNKRLERTGSLDAPPIILLNAIQKLSVTHRRRGHQISQTIEAAIENNPRLRRTYNKPDLSQDVLFTTSFVHAESQKRCTENCILHQDQILERTARDAVDDDDPAVHYGLIASADRLMKDAEARDALAATEGVLCFEMEAAGLMDRFSCVVIRGICDYSDTHKNDVWQGYAAATAAAYAKELLAVIPHDALSKAPGLGVGNEANEKAPNETRKDEAVSREGLTDSTESAPSRVNHQTFSGNFTSGGNMYAGNTYNRSTISDSERSRRN